MIESERPSTQYEQMSAYCSTMLQERYGRNPPQSFLDRAQQEVDLIRDNHQFDEVIAACDALSLAGKYGQPLLMNGTANGSLVLLLLGLPAVNPLPAHYKCRSCWHVEISGFRGFGIDLPGKACHQCGERMAQDGFDIPLESIWYKSEGRLDLSFETTALGVELIEKSLKDTYGWNNVIKSASRIIGLDGRPMRDIEHDGYFVLPEATDLRGFRKYLKTDARNETYLVFPHHEYEGRMPKIGVSVSDELSKLLWYRQSVTDLIKPDFSDHVAVEGILFRGTEDLPFLANPEYGQSDLIKDYVRCRGSLNAEILTSLYSACQSSYVDGFDPYRYLIGKSGDMGHLLCDREKALEVLVDCGVDRAVAAQAAQAIRKGKGKDSLKYVTQPVPEWLMQMADQVKYLVPRAHSISRILCALEMADCIAKFPELHAERKRIKRM